MKKHKLAEIETAYVVKEKLLVLNAQSIVNADNLKVTWDLTIGLKIWKMASSQKPVQLIIQTARIAAVKKFCVTLHN